MQIVIHLTDDEATALSLIAADAGVWLENFARERARQTVESVVQAEIAHSMSLKEVAPTSVTALLARAIQSGRAVPANAVQTASPLS